MIVIKISRAVFMNTISAHMSAQYVRTSLTSLPNLYTQNGGPWYQHLALERLGSCRLKI